MDVILKTTVNKIHKTMLVRTQQMYLANRIYYQSTLLKYMMFKYI